jgi:hypothetical protein
VGYIRNYSTPSEGYRNNVNPIGSRSVTPLARHAVGSEPFCSGFQRFLYQADGWPRLKAPPASRILPWYSQSHLARLPERVNSSNGAIFWYGSAVQISPDIRTVRDVLNFQDGIDGQRKVVQYGISISNLTIIVLAVHPYNDIVKGNHDLSFTIPNYVEVGSTYTVYWMWNTTMMVGTRWLVSQEPEYTLIWLI